MAGSTTWRSRTPLPLNCIGKVYTGSLDEAGARKISEDFACDILNQFGATCLMGTKIYFVSDRSGHKEIWSMNYDGSEQKQFTAYQSITHFSGGVRRRHQDRLHHLSFARFLPRWDRQAPFRGTAERPKSWTAPNLRALPRDRAETCVLQPAGIHERRFRLHAGQPPSAHLLHRGRRLLTNFSNRSGWQRTSADYALRCLGRRAEGESENRSGCRFCIRARWHAANI